MASPSSSSASAAAAAMSLLVSTASLLVLAFAMSTHSTGSNIWAAAATGVGGNGAPCSARERLICDPDRTTQRRCDCTPTCHYFGSCCHSEVETTTADLAATAAVNNSGGDARGAGSCSPRRLQRGLFKCELQRYGEWPTYVIDRCPPTSDQPRQLARLCDQDLRENNYYDARFWPVTSNVTYLVYQSVYCALCHGESARNITRWTASLNCPDDTDTSNRTHLLRRCKVLFTPPAAFRPPRCWNHFVDTCELPMSQRAIAAVLSAGCGAAAGIRSDESPVPAGRAARTFDASTADIASAGSLPVAGADAAVACYQAPQAVVWWGTTPFRNIHCAECSGLNVSQLVCSEVKYDPLVEYPGISFRALLDPGGGRVVVGGGGTQMRCRGDEYYDHFYEKCASLCPSGTKLAADGSHCDDSLKPFQASTQESMSPWTTSHDLNASASPWTADLNQTQHSLRPNISNCWWSSYDVAIAALKASDARHSIVLTVAGGSDRNRSVSNDVLFVVPSAAARAAATATLPESATALCAHCRWITVSTAGVDVLNRSIEAYGRRWWLRPPVVRHIAAAAIACVDPARADEYPEGIDEGGRGSCGAVLDAIGISLMIASIACLAVHAIAFFFISSLRNMPGRVVFSQVVALLLAFSLFLSRVAAATDEMACYALGVALHYFLLAYFVWTLVLAVEIHGAVRVLKKVYSGERQFAVYSLFGWLVPLIIVIAAVLTDIHGPLSLRPGYGPPQCWMNGASSVSHGFVVFFAAPMGFIVLVGIILYAAIVVRIAVISRHTARARRATPQQREKAVLCAKLLLALGVLWTFAVAGAFSGNVIVICVFSNVLNASQGVFLFAVFFCSNSRVAELLHCRELGERIRSSRLASRSLFSSVVVTGTSTANSSRYKKSAATVSTHSSSVITAPSTTRPSDWVPPLADSEERQRSGDEADIDASKQLMAA